MTHPSSCARMQVAQSDIIRTVRTNCHMWEQDLCTPISIGWSTLYMEIKMKTDNYEVILNRFRQRWMNFFLFKEMGSLLRKHSKKLFYCILLRLQSIQLLKLESDISYTFTSKQRQLVTSTHMKFESYIKMTNVHRLNLTVAGISLWQNWKCIRNF